MREAKARYDAVSRRHISVIRVGWIAFEGIGRPFEGWVQRPDGGWMVCGRAFTRYGAKRKARHAPMPTALPVDQGVNEGYAPANAVAPDGPPIGGLKPAGPVTGNDEPGQ